MAIRDLFSTLNPENTGSNLNILTQTLLNQLSASKAGKPASQGGSDDAAPVDNGGISQVTNNGSIAGNQGSVNQRNLVGQPGGAALGENVSGGRIRPIPRAATSRHLSFRQPVAAARKT